MKVLYISKINAYRFLGFESAFREQISKTETRGRKARDYGRM